MGSPLGLAGIFFDLFARTHLQHSWSLVALLLLDRFLTPLQKNSLHNTFCKGPICKHSWFLVAFAVARPVFDALQKNSLHTTFCKKTGLDRKRSYQSGGVFWEASPPRLNRKFRAMQSCGIQVWLTVPKSCIALNWMDPLMHVWARPWASPEFFLIF